MENENIGTKVEELRREALRRLETRRPELDSDDPFIYVLGHVYWDDTSKATDDNPVTTLYAYDLLALERLWEEREGLLVPKEEAEIKRGRNGGIETWGRNEGMLVRPYVAVDSFLSEQPVVLEKAVKGSLRVRYSDKPGDQYLAYVFSDSLFDAEGLGLVRLSNDLAHRFRGKEALMIEFYRQLKDKPTTQYILD